MKQLTTTIVALLLVIGLTACNQEKVTQGIYSPNQELVSPSQDDLTRTLAEALSVEAGQVAIQSLDFLDVEQGYVAEIGISTDGDPATVYYISQDLESKLEIDSSVELVSSPSGKQFGGGIVAYCSCGNNTLPSSGCRTSVTTNSDGTITGTCYLQGCAYGCVFHQK